MEITIVVNGKPVKAIINDEEFKQATQATEEQKKTGYEKPENNNEWYFSTIDGKLGKDNTFFSTMDERMYNSANCYTDKFVAEKNILADNLMRKLRRFAATHGGCLTGIDAGIDGGYAIIYDGMRIVPFPLRPIDVKEFGQIVFASKKSCEDAITKFSEELRWYFTKYNAMPRSYSKTN